MLLIYVAKLQLHLQQRVILITDCFQHITDNAQTMLDNDFISLFLWR